MIRQHFKHTDIRKAELDPSTFDHPEDWQRDCSLSFDWWRLLGLALCLASAALVGWVVITFITGE